jgi:hypothetical protein
MDGDEVFAQWSVLRQVIRHDSLQVAADRTSAELTVRVADKEIRVVVDYIEEGVSGLEISRV